ncbi:MAG: class I SAM-dependent methyltransferase [Candidatus Sumerlaeia bacterium]|nr:class I SAM-dependent methyltransferase [Candidatus Sumerlaeia bacterium]
MLKNYKKLIKYNIKAHNRIYRQYEEIHGEIFNPIEQERLRKYLSRAVLSIQTNSVRKIALDFGCGTGNLTKHLIELGLQTISADISPRFLKLVKQKFSQTDMVKTLRLNGKDLTNIPSCSLDLIAVYSVMHHIPDYLGILCEFVRVLKPGGVIYLDHEVNETYWERPPVYQEFLAKVAVSSPSPSISRRDWRRFFKPLTYWRKFQRILLNFKKRLNPRYSSEGDIHVWPDDHIEWDKIEQKLSNLGCEVVLREDYLLYKREYPLSIYEVYKDKCQDTRVLISRKRNF